MSKLRKNRLDLTSLSGIPVGVGLVILGQALAGGTLESMWQLTAGLVVFGGTLGAVLVSFSSDEVMHAVRRLRAVFIDDEPLSTGLIQVVAELSLQARRRGIVAIDGELDRLDEPFLRNGLRLVVDGNTPETVREMLEGQDRSLVERDLGAALVYESAGGYAPTFGILGAVLGLIHLMERLTDPSGLGAGIAVAFAATAYGVGAANLVFLPIATKLRARVRRAARVRHLMIEGIIAIHEGLGPHFIQLKLGGLLDDADEADVRGPSIRQAA